MKSNTEPMLPDNYYHVYNRGINGSPIFMEDKNFNYFLKKYNNHISCIADTYCYCLLKNHFHFLIKTKSEKELLIMGKSGNKSASWLIGNQFATLFKSYSLIINKTYERTGALFENVFKRKCINSDEYLTRLIYYIHANPQNHGICDDFRNYPNSSYASMISDKPTNLMRKNVLDWFGGKEEYIKFHNSDSENNMIQQLILE